MLLLGLADCGGGGATLAHVDLPIAAAVIPWREGAREAVAMLRQEFDHPTDPRPCKPFAENKVHFHIQ